MTISNPQYAFLKADYANPNLNQALWESEDSSEIKNEYVFTPSTRTNTMYQIIPTNVYLKVNSLLPFLISLPVDIYCIVLFMIGEAM
ncbi:hypothetical protein CD30_19245 [Ureibacillus massiliensis 4400831 = CIP 108448 = CCUG 49529]|uniref:Uncharacterized protein n=1 Tax=Ureibacillus massiliensis 4400831 = CIP 108448 = CCUG 49529 TaxID=1211035 RepID=A0A0A3IMY1_9BACL|nr:hypothetical protein [Ureibacillus massiliensis]KGR84795.1 hypothetical protein CD30_19245 [Ureibacillus massiliensis 4400831 = CIP 108448 = CCUG 49529]